MTILARDPTGWIPSMVPTLTPNTRTSSPGYTPVAELKYAVMVFGPKTLWPPT
jgi:hypothetical protein